MAQTILLSSMVEASRNCGWTQQLHTILSEKLTDADKVVFNEWLRVAIDQKRIDVNNAKRNNFFPHY